MIGYLKGRLQAVHETGIVLDVQGVGYLLSLPQPTLQNLPAVGQAVEFHVATIVREDNISLYGFEREFELKLYQLFMQVSGIGPKQALHLLSSAPPEELANAVINLDVHYLQSLRGVGQKTAEKIILELKNPMVKLLKNYAFHPAAASPPSLRVDLIAALTQLGYRRSQIEEALFKIELHEKKDLAGALRESLRHLGGVA